eukprot:g2160.t1
MALLDWPRHMPADVLAPGALHFYDAATAFRVGATDRQMRNALTQQLMGIKMTLRRRRLPPEVVHSLAQSLRALVGLKELEVDISFTSVGDHGACHLAQGIGTLQRLQSLELLLAGAGLGHSGCEKFAKERKGLLALCNQGVACLAQVVLELPTLSELEVALFDNRVGEDGARQMAATMRGLRKLSRLVLGLNRNAVSEAGVQARLC